ncbi:SH3 domain protein [Candidatus Regiella insecticola 5.15]|uniref:SH3 domain protein n=1 Tax=Candidatus Regiella insecticola 5.15 TaxID=1005043 RepID=G2H1J8_9ENTR|nr:TIGR04211 family SH3 domain-containing protein [Candidatus Regiella insecticola]EGY28132.1 SH3 domain protein [Candidatus Regiella insecticola 5.15]
MHKLPIVCFAMLIFTISWHSSAEEKRYISDKLITYVHSGPGSQYRIVGSLNVGDEVTLLSVNQSENYAQIRDAKDRVVWLPLNQLSSSASLRLKLPELEQQVETLTSQLQNIDADWNQRTAEMQQKLAESDDIISKLNEENDRLENQLVKAQTEIRAMSLQQDNKQRAIILQWFMYGGSVAGIGLILGLLMPYLIPSPKKKDRWMN